jgi:hypothetical protein
MMFAPLEGWRQVKCTDQHAAVDYAQVHKELSDTQHYTLTHGNWLDMAASELGILSSQCLSRRISDKQTLIEEVVAWQHNRNKKHTRADWRFTTADAWVKLKRLYPVL